jgi:hypothetical protein
MNNHGGTQVVLGIKKYLNPEDASKKFASYLPS